MVRSLLKTMDILFRQAGLGPGEGWERGTREQPLAKTLL